MLFVLIDYDESRRNAQYCAKIVLQMIELMRLRYKNITEDRSDQKTAPQTAKGRNLTRKTTTY
jgi:hypothetical protein